jgi:hypothetical protein
LCFVILIDKKTSQSALCFLFWKMGTVKFQSQAPCGAVGGPICPAGPPEAGTALRSRGFFWHFVLYIDKKTSQNPPKCTLLSFFLEDGDGQIPKPSPAGPLEAPSAPQGRRLSRVPRRTAGGRKCAPQAEIFVILFF